jgi:hypothetical protein
VLVDFLRANADVFVWSRSDMPGIPRDVAEHSLDIRAGARPVKQPLRRFDEEKHRAIDEEIHKLMAAGFIKEVFHPEWLANPVLVRKKGGKWRMCVDYTGLNKACPKVPYPLPRIDQIEVRRLEDKFYRLELNHIARRYNETADELAKIASGRTTVPSDVFSRDLHQPSVKTDDTPEPEKASAQPEAPSVQHEAPSAPEGEALRVEGERNGVPPNRDWQTPYLQYLHRGELPLDRAEAR